MLRLSIPSINEQEVRAIAAVLRTGFLVQGKKVAEFEKAIADLLDVPFAVAVNSGTSALHLALIAAGVRPGDEVIIPDLSFPATANVIELTGARPVIVDIEPVTYNMDPKRLEEAITSKTKVIMPVHLFGQSADMDPIMKIARKHKIVVVEDAACVLGARYKGKYCGTIGEIGCFSFHPRKIITTGEGGVIVTKNKSVADRLKLIRNHGMLYTPDGIEFEEAGYNNRLTEFQAAMGLVQLKKLNRIIRARQNGFKVYNLSLKGIPWLHTPVCAGPNTHIVQSYIVRVADDIQRNDLIRYLKENKIEAGIGTYAMHRIKFYKNKYKLQSADFPVADMAFDKLMSLPLYEGLSAKDMGMIAKRIKQFR